MGLDSSLFDAPQGLEIRFESSDHLNTPRAELTQQVNRVNMLELLSTFLNSALTYKDLSPEQKTLFNCMTIDTAKRTVYYDANGFRYPVSHSTPHCLDGQSESILVDTGERVTGTSSNSAEEEAAEAAGSDSFYGHFGNLTGHQQDILRTLLRVVEESDPDSANETRSSCCHAYPGVRYSHAEAWRSVLRERGAY